MSGTVRLAGIQRVQVEQAGDRALLTVRGEELQFVVELSHQDLVELRATLGALEHAVWAERERRLNAGAPRWNDRIEIRAVKPPERWEAATVRQVLQGIIYATLDNGERTCAAVCADVPADRWWRPLGGTP